MSEDKTEKSEKSEFDLRLERREAKRAKEREAYEKQRLADLDALESFEELHGSTSVGYVNVDHSPGLPTMVIVRTPNALEIKRYRSHLLADPTGRKGPPDAFKAAAELASVQGVNGDNPMILYPAPDVYAKILEKRPGIHEQVGGKAAHLALGREAAEGKGGGA